MRILHICSAREIGGGEKHLADLVNALASRGHEIFAAIRPGSPVRAELSSLPSEHIIELPMPNALSVGSALKLARLVRERRLEIVHAHLARDYSLGAIASGRTGAELILTRHVLFPLRKIHRLTLRRTARVIAVSGAVAGSLRNQNIFPPQRIVTIHNGIDMARFAPAGRPDGDGRRLRVGTIGHLAPIKGQEDFIRAAAMVRRGRRDIEFIIAGEDKSRGGENRASLEKLIRELDLGREVELAGWVEDVGQLLATFDLFISPSRSEPFGLAIVEAMAAGVCVVSTASEGAREIIVENHSGRLVPIGDVNSIAGAISDLLADKNERDRLAANARTEALARFSLQQMVDRTEQLYREVIVQAAH